MVKAKGKKTTDYIVNGIIILIVAAIVLLFVVGYIKTSRINKRISELPNVDVCESAVEGSKTVEQLYIDGAPDPIISYSPKYPNTKYDSPKGNSSCELEIRYEQIIPRDDFTLYYTAKLEVEVEKTLEVQQDNTSTQEIRLIKGDTDDYRYLYDFLWYADKGHYSMKVSLIFNDADTNLDEESLQSKAQTIIAGVYSHLVSHLPEVL